MKIISASALLFLPVLLAAAPLPAKPPPKPAAKSSAVKPPVKAPAKVATQAAAAPKAGNFNTAKTYPAQTIAFSNGVVMTTQEYAHLPGFRPLMVDLYLPAGKSFPRPGLIFVHGGGWFTGDSRHGGTFGDFPGLLASIAARGFVVASIDYRLSGEAHFPAAVQDVKSAIRWLSQHAGEYNVDNTRIALWGAAAGGHLAALAGVSCGVTSLEPDAGADPKPASDCVQAVIDWYGISDLETRFTDFGKATPDKSEEGALLGCEPALCPVTVAHNASPLAYIEATAPPFLIQHGAADTNVSLKQSQRLYDALRAKNVPAELVVYPGVNHNFAPVANTIPGAVDETVNREAVEKLEAFLDATFPKKPAAASSKAAPAKPAPSKGLPY